MFTSRDSPIVETISSASDFSRIFPSVGAINTTVFLIKKNTQKGEKVDFENSESKIVILVPDCAVFPVVRFAGIPVFSFYSAVHVQTADSLN